MRTDKLNRAMYLMYHFNHRTISSDEMQELQRLINEWKLEYDKRMQKKDS